MALQRRGVGVELSVDIQPLLVLTNLAISSVVMQRKCVNKNMNLPKTGANISFNKVINSAIKVSLTVSYLFFVCTTSYRRL